MSFASVYFSKEILFRKKEYQNSTIGSGLKDISNVILHYIYIIKQPNFTCSIHIL